MKKIIYYSFFLIVMLFSTTSFAQDDAARYQKSTTEPTVRAKKKADKIVQLIGSDASTSAKIYDLYLARVQKTDEIKGGSATNEEKEKALKTNKDDFENKLKSLIGEAKFLIFKAAKEEDSKKDN